VSGPQALYHWTCSHGARGIRTDGLIKPAQWPLRLVWLTTERRPRAGLRQALGLTSNLLSCDRMTALFRVDDTKKCQRWLDTADADTAYGQMLAGAPGADPSLWWVCAASLPARQVAPGRLAP
jgi:hypothetical protein